MSEVLPRKTVDTIRGLKAIIVQVFAADFSQLKNSNSINSDNDTRQKSIIKNILAALAIAFILTPCCLAQTTIFEDNFDDSSLAKWDKFGYPSPVALSSAEGRTGVFDNKGDSMYDSGAISKEAFSLQNGFTLQSDIFLRIANPSGSFAAVDFGLTDSQEPNQVEYGIEWHPNNHAYLRGHFITENGNWENYGFWDISDTYINNWHNWKVVVGSDRYVDFYLDNNLIYHSQNRISTSVLEGKRLSISGRSLTGKAYNDYISLRLSGQNMPPSKPIPPSGPISCTPEIDYIYSTSSTDPDGDQVKYTFDWDDGSNDETLYMNEGEIGTAPHSWSTPGTYNVKAMATDTEGASSEWSESLTVEVTPRDIITFSGLEWSVRDTGSVTEGPSNNYWTRDNVWVDAYGRLHLNITQKNGKWYCAQVQALEPLGYGEYTFYTTLVKGNLRKQVLGMSSYLDEAHAIGIEITKAFPTYNDETFCLYPTYCTRLGCSKYSVSPFEPNSCRVSQFEGPDFDINDPKMSQSTHRFIWDAPGIFFESHWRHANWPKDTSDIISFWSYNYDSANLVPNVMKPRINLWINNENGPFPDENPTETEIIIDKFEFHELRPLRNLAGDFRIGYASSNDFWDFSDEYSTISKREFNILTPENQMKFDFIHPKNTGNIESDYNFVPADKHVQFAKDNDMMVHGHTLIWGDPLAPLPDWVRNGAWNKKSLSDIMEHHIKIVMGHYVGSIYIWDVINEAINESGNYKEIAIELDEKGNEILRENVWYKYIGVEYIEKAFKAAHDADPDATLIYNDFDMEVINKKSDKVFEIIKDFKSRGIPIDGIGFQFHRNTTDFNDEFYKSFARNMRRFADLGLDIYITEMEIKLPEDCSVDNKCIDCPANCAPDNFLSQALIYRNILHMCLSQPACKGLQMWGLTDKYSWHKKIDEPMQRYGYIFDVNYHPKWSYYSLQSELASASRLSWMALNLRSHADLHIYDPLDRHIGKNYTTGNIDTDIPGAIFTNNGTQYIYIPSLEMGNYRIVLIGTSCGPYELNILGGLEDTTLINETYSGSICEGIIHDASVNLMMSSGLNFYLTPPKLRSNAAIDDLNVSSIAQVNGFTIEQVIPNQIFNYNITITNKDLTNDASQVVLTNKLPHDVEYIGTEVYPVTPLDYTISQSGDLIYARFNQISAGTTRYINITVKAPSEAPTTMYNIVNLRYKNDPNISDNSLTLSTYVPLIGYNQTEAAKSFEDLLHNQSQLLFQFEDLLHTIPSNNSTNYTFLVSFEQLLRSQADLTSNFEDLLSNSSSTGWDTEYTEENRTFLLRSYEQMLWDEAFLFASFDMKIDDSWTSLCNYTADGHSQDAQTELIASFEDLLKRQTRLYKSFNLLLTKIDITSHQDMIDFLAAYENLLRVEANLLMSFDDLLDTKYENPNCPKI